MVHFVWSRQRKYFSLVSVMVGLFVFGHLAHAKVNDSWSMAYQFQPPFDGQTLYGAIGRQGSSWYTFSVNQPTTITTRLSVPTWSSRNFEPRLVLYQPESSTIGPILPMEQPPNTSALIYPATESSLKFQSLSFITVNEKLSTTLHLTQPGQYYVAVYNAGQDGGRWRLDFGQRRADWNSLWRWPMIWQVDQAWNGWTWQSCLIPLLLLSFVLSLSMICLHRWPHAHPKEHQKKKHSHHAK